MVFGVGSTGGLGAFVMYAGSLALPAMLWAGPGDKAREVTAMQTVLVRLEGPKDAAVDTKVSVQVRVFEGEDPDAPPQVTNLAFKSANADRLRLPMTIVVDVPVDRLAGALQPAVGVLVLSEGNMIFWNDQVAPLSQTDPTIIQLARVP